MGLKTALIGSIAVWFGAILGAQPQTPARSLTAEQWVIDGAVRTGLVAAPPATVSGAGAPLVFVFHGHGGSSRNISRTLAIHAEWPEAAVIYLQGLPAPSKIERIDPEGRLPGWQNAPGALGNRDVKLVDAVLVWAKQKYRIDARRVYATGQSNGGLFTYLLWAERPDVVAAVAPASAVFTDMIRSAKPKPALLIAGEEDMLVLFAIQKRNADAILRLNQCDTKGMPWSGDAVLHRSRVGADTIVYVHPGGHALPRDAAALVTRFFKDH